MSDGVGTSHSTEEEVTDGVGTSHSTEDEEISDGVGTSHITEDKEMSDGVGTSHITEDEEMSDGAGTSTVLRVVGYNWAFPLHGHDCLITSSKTTTSASLRQTRRPLISVCGESGNV